MWAGGADRRAPLRATHILSMPQHLNGDSSALALRRLERPGSEWFTCIVFHPPGELLDDVATVLALGWARTLGAHALSLMTARPFSSDGNCDFDYGRRMAESTSLRGCSGRASQVPQIASGKAGVCDCPARTLACQSGTPLDHPSDRFAVCRRKASASSMRHQLPGLCTWPRIFVGSGRHRWGVPGLRGSPGNSRALPVLAAARFSGEPPGALWHGPSMSGDGCGWPADFFMG